MRIVVSDSSCLIDLRKASLLDAFLHLPYEIVIPNTLFDDELLKFSAAQKRTLLRGGLKVLDLPSEGVLRAQHIAQTFPQISIHDSFAFALAEAHPGCILLTGDGALRALATNHQIEVHGMLWLIDELHTAELAEARVLHDALHLFANDPTARLPAHDLAAAIARYRHLVA